MALAESTSPTREHELEQAQHAAQAHIAVTNTPRMLSYGADPEKAYPGAQLAASVTSDETPAKIEYSWHGFAQAPEATWLYWMGPEPATYTEPEEYSPGGNAPSTMYLSVRLSWDDGSVSYAQASVPEAQLSVSAGTFNHTEKTFTPGTSLDTRTLFTPSRIASTEGYRVFWWVNVPTKWTSHTSVASKSPIITIQPSWRGKKLTGNVYRDTPNGLEYTDTTWTYKIADEATPTPAISLPSTTAGRLLTVKVGPHPQDAQELVQWRRNGKTIQDFTDEYGTQINTDLTDVAAKYEASVRLAYPDGTFTAPKTATTTVSTPSFAAPKTTVSGTFTVTKRLKVSAGIGYVPAKVTRSITWLRDGKAIPRATGTSYTLTSADAGHKVSVRITYKPFDGPAKVSTSPARVVAKAKIVAGGVLITGQAKQGTTLRASLRKIPGVTTSGVSVRYQWLRDGKAIPGATGATRKVVKADAGHALSVRATVTKAGYTSATSTSGRSLIPQR